MKLDKTISIIAMVLLTLGAAATRSAPPRSVPLRSAELVYPPAVRGTTIDDYHGTKVPDPYRGLENLDSAATRAWVGAEGQLTSHYLARIALRDQLRSRLTTVFNYERFGIPLKD